MSSPAALPLLAGLGPQEVVVILLVVVLLFGAKKLPELARGSGRALRIFKAETKGLLGDDDDDVPASQKTEAQLRLDAQRRTEAAQRVEPAAEAPVERVRPVEVEHVRPVEVEHPRPDVER